MGSDADANVSSTESEEELVSCEDLISDESSFCGGEELKAEYEAQAASFDPSTYWHSRNRNLQWITEQSREAWQSKKDRTHSHVSAREPATVKIEPATVKVERGTQSEKPLTRRREYTPMDVHTEPGAKEPFNAYEGVPCAKQLGETLEAFLSRLPPSTTKTEAGPWIWIANPFSSHRPLQSDVGGFKTCGHELLGEYMNKKAKMEDDNPGKPPGTITRKLKADQKWLEQSIIDLAKSKGITNGKWMLFPFANAVDEAWRKVAKATLTGTLGCAAKVATDDGSGAPRLICVYTEDFTNKADVKRVLRKMQDLQLFQGDQSIYYKCDAYTYLSIMNGNDYKLKASMYSSKDLLKEILMDWN